MLVDTLVCSDCAFKREKQTSFTSISIDIPDYLESQANADGVIEGPKCRHLAELIDLQLKPEVLEEDNCWNCDQCKAKVRATKALSYDSLPQLLFVHLKRFRFDPVRVISIVLCWHS